jgi:hypothetical protein
MIRKMNVYVTISTYVTLQCKIMMTQMNLSCRWGETASLNCGKRAYCSSPSEHGELWWNDIGRGKAMIRPPELSDSINSRDI